LQKRIIASSNQDCAGRFDLSGKLIITMALSRGQMITLAWIYWAYVCCYLVRKNMPLLLPALNEKELLTTSEAGIVASVFEMVVGIVKFFCGTFVDASEDPAWLLSQCLLLAGTSCLGMQAVFWFLTGSGVAGMRLTLVSVLWSLNGTGQAVAWPALARVFMNWFPDANTRGTFYSILATNQNLGGTLAPKLYPPLIEAYGWDIALYAPALLTFFYGAAMATGLSSFPPSEKKEKDPEAAASKQPKKNAPGFVEACTTLLKIPAFVSLAIAYIPIMFIRTSLATWTAIIFQGSNMDLAKAASCMSALEVGGFVGGLSAGFITDKVFGGRRGPLMLMFSLFCVPLCLAFSPLLQMDEADLGPLGLGKMATLQLLYFAIGFMSFPPHSLIGLASREISPVEMRSTAGCLAKAIGQLGASAAGWPLQQLAVTHGWGSVSYINGFCGVAAAVAFIPMWNQGAAVKALKTK
jgi:OPA family sugar phosphate sensor protein UhpC-like MFS transporter